MSGNINSNTFFLNSRPGIQKWKPKLKKGWQRNANWMRPHAGNPWSVIGIGVFTLSNLQGHPFTKSGAFPGGHHFNDVQFIRIL